MAAPPSQKFPLAFWFACSVDSWVGLAGRPVVDSHIPLSARRPPWFYWSSLWDLMSRHGCISRLFVPALPSNSLLLAWKRDARRLVLSPYRFPVWAMIGAVLVRRFNHCHSALSTGELS